MVVRTVTKVALALLCAGICYIAWMAIFLLTAEWEGSLIQAIRWLSAPVITATGFALGIALSERVTGAERNRLLCIYAWPLIGCSIGAGAVYWLGPMLIVFGMFAAGTASVLIRELTARRAS
jgi:hypothetical protein